MTESVLALPTVVSAAEWQAAREELLAKEKAATRALDALAAERRRLPMVEFPSDYQFDGPAGPVSLLDLFAGRRQLIVYHFMLFAGDDHRCPGCSMMVDGLGHLGHLAARDTTFVVTSPAPRSEIEPYRERMGWTVPWFSASTAFTEDCGTGPGFGISVFLRGDDAAGDSVYRTYFTTSRGADLLNTTLRWLDLTPLGRQEAWEQAGRGDSPPGSWWRLHDEYV